MSKPTLIPLSTNDKQQWIDAVSQVSQNLSGAQDWAAPAPHKHVYVATFDGTNNNRTQVPAGEVPTNPAQLETELSKHYDGKTLTGRYYAGVGSYGNVLEKNIDAATGHGASGITERAYQDFDRQAQQWLAADPNADIRVVAIGFSRGAAEARNFLNQVNDRGVHSPGGGIQGKAPGSVRSSALLYDTVATGQDDILKQVIPPTTDYVVHLTSRDEPRVTFPLTSIKGPGQDPATHIEVTLPGVHSDIGGGYAEGPDKMGKYIGDIALSRLGLPVTPGMAPLESLNEGRHDSSWPLTPFVRPVVDVFDGPGRKIESAVPNDLGTAAETLLNKTLDKVEKGANTLSAVQANASYEMAQAKSWVVDLVNDGKCLTMQTDCPDAHFDVHTGTLTVNGHSHQLAPKELQQILNGAGMTFEVKHQEAPEHKPAQAAPGPELHI